MGNQPRERLCLSEQEASVSSVLHGHVCTQGSCDSGCPLEASGSEES